MNILYSYINDREETQTIDIYITPITRPIFSDCKQR